MLNLNWQIIWAFVNIIILVVLLKKFLFKPVTDMMEKRTKMIEDSFAEAKAKNEEAQALKEQYEASLAEAEEEAARLIRSARQTAAHQTDEMLAAAQAEAHQLVEKARQEIDRQRRKAMQDVRESAAELAVMAAAQMLHKEADTEENHQLVEQYLKEQVNGHE